MYKVHTNNTVSADSERERGESALLCSNKMDRQQNLCPPHCNGLSATGFIGRWFQMLWWEMRRLQTLMFYRCHFANSAEWKVKSHLRASSGRALDGLWTGSGLFAPHVLLLLSTADGLPLQSNCSYQAVLNHLELTRENELYTMTRPVQNHTQITWVSLEVLLYAILDVVSGCGLPAAPVPLHRRRL